MNKVIAVLSILAFLPACSPSPTAAPIPTLAPSQVSMATPLPTNTAIPTLIPTETKAPTAAPTATPSIPMLEIGGLKIPDPKVTNPEFFDLGNANSPVVQFANAMNSAGITIGAEQISDEINYLDLTDKAGNPFVLAVYNLDPDPNSRGEILEGKVPLAIAKLNDSGEWKWEGFSLINITEMTGIQTGALVSGWRLDENPKYRDVFLNNYSMPVVTSPFWEDMKNSKLTNIDFSNIDQLVDRARQTGLPAEFQHIIPDEWRWYPDSAQTEKLTPEAGEEILRTHVRTVMERYKDTVTLWSVVNEAINGDAKGGFTHNPWYDALGINYIRVAFDEARKTAPDATLMYNDFDLENDRTKRAQVHEFLQLLIDAGLVDAVGIQMHYDASHLPDKAGVLEAMKEIGSWGVSVHVTELDVDLTQFQGTPEQKLLKQAQIYKEMMSAFLESGYGATFSTFGFTDLTSMFGTDKSPEALAAAPLPFDSDLNPKAAYYGMLQAVTDYLPNR